MRVERLDHLVLTVVDVPATVAFYSQVMGMREITFGAGRKALAFGQQKLNLHQRGAELEPRATAAIPGSADLCFVVSDQMDDLLAHLATCRVPILEGPVSRTGALGPIQSVYFRDPDGNLIEVSRYEHSD